MMPEALTNSFRIDSWTLKMKERAKDSPSRSLECIVMQ